MKKALWIMAAVVMVAMTLSVISIAVADTDADIQEPAPAVEMQPENPAEPVEEGTLIEEELEEEISVVVPETFTGSVEVELVNKGSLYYGDEIILRAKVENANMAYTLRWEVLDGSEWKPIPNETGAEYHFIVNEENAGLQYRVVVITA